MHKVGHRDGGDGGGGGDSRRRRPLDTLRCRGQAPLTRQSRRGEWGRSIEERTPRGPREELLASCALLVNALQASVIHTTHTQASVRMMRRTRVRLSQRTSATAGVIDSGCGNTTSNVMIKLPLRRGLRKSGIPSPVIAIVDPSASTSRERTLECKPLARAHTLTHTHTHTYQAR